MLWKKVENGKLGGIIENWVHLIFQWKIKFKGSPKYKIPLYIKKLFPSNSNSNIPTRSQQRELFFRSHRIMLHQHLCGKSQRKIPVLSIKSKRFYPCMFKRCFQNNITTTEYFKTHAIYFLLIYPGRYLCY